MARGLRLLLVVLSLGVAAACSGPTTIGPPYRSPATGSVLVYASAHGPMLVEVVGDPFGQGTAQLAATVAGEMSGQVQTYPFAFTPDLTKAPHPAFRVVVAFGSVGGRLCGPRPSAVASPGRHIDVTAAFCAQEEELSSVFGWVEDVDGPNDWRFAFLMADVTRQLFG